MIGNLSWRDAILRVLQLAGQPLHYTEIADRIVDQKLRNELGATPASSVNVTISLSLKNEANKSPFIRVARGFYALRDTAFSQPVTTAQDGEAEIDETGLINAFGMYWKREKVLWSASPRVLGQQQPGSQPVDFAAQRGVYLLHSNQSVVYVGRTTDQTLGRRLYQHTVDRLNGRWDGFSWFGIYAARDNGTLNEAVNFTFDINSLIVTLEALLIEGLEPPQNRKRGDEFRAIEFLQVEDPMISKNKILALMDELKTKL